IALVAVAALAGYAASVLTAPARVMRRAWRWVAAKAGVNALYVVDTEEGMYICPDLQLIVVAYDVGRDPVHLRCLVPDTYWSLALYSARAHCYYVCTDRDSPAATFDLHLGALGSETTGRHPREGEIRIGSPTRRGFCLIRMLKDRPTEVARACRA